MKLYRPVCLNQELTVFSVRHLLLRRLMAGIHQKKGLVRIHQEAAFHQLVHILHGRFLLIADRCVAVAVGILHQDHIPVGEYRHKGVSVLQRIGVLHHQLLVDHDHIAHLLISAAYSGCPQDGRKNSRQLGINQILCDHLPVNGGETAVYLSLEQLL